MALGNVNVAGVMKSDIKEVQQNINDLIGQTENTGGTVTEGTVMAKLNKLLTDWTMTRAGYLDLLNRSVGIKGIQRGKFYVAIKNGIPENEKYTITLSTVVPSKTVILTKGKMFNTSGTICEDMVMNVGTTYFEYFAGWGGSASGGYTIHWQAIEFY